MVVKRIIKFIKMNNIIFRLNFIVFLQSLFIALIAFSCENVTDGLDGDYDDSTADFSVQLLTEDRGAVDDTVSYLVTVTANSNIKSLYVDASTSGQNGSSFAVDEDNDPFVDHAYGTVQSGTKSISLRYNYIVGQDSVDVDLIFNLVDETGIVRDTQEVVTVPPITEYDDVILYSQGDKYVDGFSTSDGSVYHYLPDYEDYTTSNIAVQESIDLVFIVDNDSLAVLAGPYDGYFDSDFSEKNKTLFVLLDDLTSDDFDAITTASLSSITEDYAVKKGSSNLSDVWVGDVIGFRTDYASTNSYHYGILRVTAMHPTEVDYYEGTSYMMEMDIKVQTDNE